MSFQLHFQNFKPQDNEKDQLYVDLKGLVSKFPLYSTINCKISQKYGQYEATCDVFTVDDEFGIHTSADNLQLLADKIHGCFEQELEEWRKDRFDRETFETPHRTHWLDD